MIKTIRNGLAQVLFFLAYLVLPSKRPRPVQNKADKLVEKKTEEKVRIVPFTSNMSAYFAALQDPQHVQESCMSICHSLWNLVEQRKQPIRLRIYHGSTYLSNGKVENVEASNISCYKGNRWYRLRPVEINVNTMAVMISEMSEIMAQHGWGSMNDGTEQLQSYMKHCLRNARDYAVMHSGATGEKVKVGIAISFVVSEGENDNANLTPQITIRTSITTGTNKPVESQVSIFYRQSSPDPVKLAT